MLDRASQTQLDDETRRDELARRQAELVAAQNRRVVARIPLYQAAVGALRAAAVAGEDPAICWVREFAPLTQPERVVVRQRFLEELARKQAREARR